MTSRNLYTGVFLLGLGLLFLGQNFGWFNLEWHELARFWPVLVILLGVNLLLGRRSRTASVVTVLLLAVAVPLAIVSRHHDRWEQHGFYDHNDNDNDDDHSGYDEDDDDNESDRDTTRTESIRIGGTQSFSEPMDSSLQTASFHLEGGAAHFDLGGTSSQLAEARTDLGFGSFSLQKTLASDGKNASLNFSMKGDKKMEWKDGDWDGNLKNRVNISLNPAVLWDITAEIGAGEADFDLSGYRVNRLKLDTGVTSTDVKLGDRSDLTTVDIDAGVAGITLNVPKTSGCRVKKDGLSLTELDGFDKVGDYYQTPGYEGAAKKINIDFDGGIVKLEVRRY